MTSGTDRRSVLTGLGAIGVMGCSQQAAPEAAPTAQPERPAVAMQAIDVSGLETRNGGRLGFVALDTATGRSLGWRATERFVYCSTFKMYLAAATFVRIQDGRETADRMIPISRADMVNHAPVTEPAIGSSLSVGRLMQAVVEVSDNPAANLLLKANGGIAAMQNFYRSIGDDSTRADRFEPEMNRLDGDKDTIQPAQSVTNLQRLFLSPNSPLTAGSQARLLRWMVDSPTGADRLKAGVPAGWRVAHKTGTGGYGPTNDIGLLYPPNGKPVIVAAYYHATSASSAAANDAVIADAARLALKALGHD
ncbi:MULTISPECIES: class A beta-lactamase [unclassified Brevundimonas]|uniref:class A beta-lactamase n=1 Tax=unclassified Brevundimonas TaxID=2622653 RepID=UPI0006F1D9CC|nr:MULTISPECIES: class A beta-lactamase [unclassified Brevundimonas]KQY83572.1 class A beta-lactamase [Brevundimonas sp. Root1423]KRA26392.1 class A beta-lactamase [Brevundimonas sp. Root608]